MATLQQIANERKRALKALRAQSLKLNTAQEAVDRELVRLINRKKSIPEARDMDKLVQLLKTVDNYSDEFARSIQNVAAVIEK